MLSRQKAPPGNDTERLLARHSTRRIAGKLPASDYFSTNPSSLVFTDSIAQGKAMLASFTSDVGGQRSSPGQEPVIEDLLHWTMTVTLHVLSAAAFTLKMPWPVKSVLATPTDSPKEIKSTFKVTEKHTMSFQQSLDTLMDYLPFIIFFPSWLLRNSPLAVMRKMQHCADEFRTYMSELIADSTGSDVARGDLLGSIVRASSADEKTPWTTEDTIGNIFVFILAGHETTASTLQSAIILLACHPGKLKSAHILSFCSRASRELFRAKRSIPKTSIRSILIYQSQNTNNNFKPNWTVFGHLRSRTRTGFTKIIPRCDVQWL
jgi:hypothetical protein